MIAEKRWLVWRWQERDGRRTKVPYRADDPSCHARSNDPETWGDHATAAAAAAAGQGDGIGYALASGVIGALDLDDALDAAGEPLPWAWDLIRECGTYVERTVGGNGLRILGFAEGSKVHRKFKVPGTVSSVEAYRQAERYIVVTGAALDGHGGELRNIDPAIDALVTRLDLGRKARTTSTAGPTKLKTPRPCDGSDLPPALFALIRDGVPAPGRSEQFFRAVAELKGYGYDVDDIEELFTCFLTGIAEKFEHRLRAEVERAFGKAAAPFEAGVWFEEPPPEPPRLFPDDTPEALPMISATPFVWHDPTTFPRRRWLYGHHLIRKFTSCTVAPGGLGKSSLVLVEAIAMATGRPLLGVHAPESPLTVWVLNLEDPQEEIERRVMAILLHYQIDPAEIVGRLYVDSGRRVKLVVAEATRAGTVIAKPIVAAFTAEIRARKVDVVVIDPFVKSHRVPENDNGAIDMVATVFADIADACDCAFDLVHHVRKTGGAEVTVEDGRGAVALLGAVRSARALNGMTKEEAAKVGEGARAREFFRADNGKLNMAPAPPDRAEWFRLVSVPLGNGDTVGCVVTWQWPDTMAGITPDHLREVQAAISDGRWRENHQARNWVGIAVANVLDLDLADKAQKAKVLGLVKAWLKCGALVVVNGQDERRKPVQFIEPGGAAA